MRVEEEVENGGEQEDEEEEEEEEETAATPLQVPTVKSATIFPLRLNCEADFRFFVVFTFFV